MSAATYLSSTNRGPNFALSDVRVSGGVGLRAAMRLGECRVVDTRERDGYKVRFPRRSRPPEAVIINTGGGLAGGDDVLQDIIVEADAALTVTTQAAERAYRSLDNAETKVDVRATVKENASLFWLPQETIIFDGARLDRHLTLDIASSSNLLAAEIVILGRQAMGETLRSGLFRDKWRIRRDDRLVFAENVLLEDEALARMSANAMTGGAQTLLTLIHMVPDAEDRLRTVRDVLATQDFECAASAWNGFLVVRGLADRSEDVRKVMSELVPVLGCGQLPRVWAT